MIEKIRAEIDRLLDVIAEAKADTPDRLIMASSQVKVLLDLKKFIDSLSEKPVSENLEDAAQQYAKYTAAPPSDVAYHFVSGANWQKEYGYTVGDAVDFSKRVRAEYKERMIDKACEWLLNNIRYYSTNALGAEYMCNDFREAMEDEK